LIDTLDQASINAWSSSQSTLDGYLNRYLVDTQSTS